MTIRGKPSLDDFLDGAKAQTPAKAKPAKTDTTRARMTKTIRLAADLDEMLKEQAYLRTREQGQRVTESDIIEDALRIYFSK
jgi:hypothetical protein